MNRRIILSAVVWAIALCLTPRFARGDCGSVPFTAPLNDGIEIQGQEHGPDEVKFDPLKVTVFEPRQRAIILWNGEEETLLLSTDQKASQRSAVLEVIPLPNRPEVSLGSFKTFEVAQKMVIEKNMWAYAHPGTRPELIRASAPPVRIAFDNKLGAHNLTVAEVVDRDRFGSFVQEFLRERYQTQQAPIRPEFMNIIQSYLDQGFRWFAFDVITLDKTTASREPIQYRFKSDRVFYPLRISSLEVGKTEADLLVFTGAPLTRFEGMARERMKIIPATEVSRREVSQMNDQWGLFFGALNTVQMTRWTIEGKSADLLKDVSVR